jgi:hypothetical protein
MGQCSHCKAEIPDSVQVCSHCGQTVENDQVSSASSGEALTTQDQGEDTLQLRAIVATPSAPVVSPLAKEYSSISIKEVEPAQETAGEAEMLSVPMEDQPANEHEPVESLEDTADTIDSVPASEVEQEREHEDLQLSAEAVDPVQESNSLQLAEKAAEQEEESNIPPLSSLVVEPAQESADPQPVIAPDENVLPTSPQESDEPGLELARKKRGGRLIAIVALLVVVLVVAGGAGALALARHGGSGSQNATPCTGQQTGCSSGNPAANNGAATHLTFSGVVSGPMTLNASPACQNISVANLGTLTVTLTGVVAGQIYNFGFTINHYHGTGTYSSATGSMKILFDTPGESTANGWGNTSATDSGTITIASGEHSGTITYTLSGFGSMVKSQLRVSGSWVCG